MAGFLKPPSTATRAGNAAAKLRPDLGPPGASALDPDLQKNIGMGSSGKTQVVGSVLGSYSTPGAADFQRHDNSTRSPVSQTYIKRSK